MSTSTSSVPWWPFRRRHLSSPVAPLPEAPASITPDPLIPQVDAPMSAFWKSGRVQPTKANEFLDVLAQALASAKERSFQILALQEGSSVLDVGCGNGRDAARLKELVGPTGEVWGVDNSPAMIEQARAQFPQVHFLVSNVNQLPFHDGFFDAVRAERLLQHVDDPLRAFREMTRVTKPGGIIATTDGDAENTKIHPCDLSVCQRYMSFTMKRLLRNPRVSLQLYDYLISLGLAPALESAASIPMTARMMLEDMQRNFATSAFSSISPAARQIAVAEGVITAEESEAMERSIQEGLDTGTFLMMGSMLILYLRAPSHRDEMPE